MENLQIIDMGMDAVGIAKLDGKVYFVPYSITGEKVNVKITKENKNFAQAQLIEVVQSSKERINPPCPYYYECGGCCLQHVDYNYSLEYKTNYVKSILKKNSGLDLQVNSTIPSNKSFGYRNKAVFNIADVGGETLVGMYSENSHKTIPLTECLLDDGFSKNLILATYEFITINKLSGYNQATRRGLLKGIMLRKIEDKYLIVLIATTNIKCIQSFVDILKKYFDNFGLFVNINNQNNSLILTDNYIHVYGLKNITSIFSSNNKQIAYNISPHSFMQINDYIRDLIYNKVAQICKDSDYVVDAYSGAGLLSAILSTTAKQVYGLEIVKSATEDADRLKNQNNIKNLTNINCDCVVGLPNLYQKLDNAQFYLVIDPPRKGVDQAVVDATLQVMPQKIIYISCNPATLGRDLKGFMSSGQYDVELVQPYDMFPQTGHVETLVVLNKKL